MLRRVSVVGAIVLVAALVGTLLARWPFGGGERASLTVTVAGRPAHVAEGTTLAGAAARFGLHMRDGDVLDVNEALFRCAESWCGSYTRSTGISGTRNAPAARIGGRGRNTSS